MPNFYYTDTNGQRQRLVNEEKLKLLATLGIITPDTLLEIDDGRKGKAGQIEGLFDAVAAPQPELSNTTVYFYTDRSGEKQGLFDAQQLKRLARQGLIAPHTPFETATGQEGLAGQIPDLFSFTPPPAPVRPSSVFNPLGVNLPLIGGTTDRQKSEQRTTFFGWFKFWSMMVFAVLPLSVLSGLIGYFINDVPLAVLMSAIPHGLLGVFMVLSALYWILIMVFRLVMAVVHVSIKIVKKMTVFIKQTLSAAAKTVRNQFIGQALFHRIPSVTDQPEKYLCVIVGLIVFALLVDWCYPFLPPIVHAVKHFVMMASLWVIFSLAYIGMGIAGAFIATNDEDTETYIFWGIGFALITAFMFFLDWCYPFLPMIIYDIVTVIWWLLHRVVYLFIGIAVILAMIIFVIPALRAAHEKIKQWIAATKQQSNVGMGTVPQPIEIIIDGVTKTVTKQELFGFVTSAKVNADTPVCVNGKLVTVETAMTLS